MFHHQLTLLPTWGGNYRSTLLSDLLLTIFVKPPEVCQLLNQNLKITFLNSLILSNATTHGMTQTTGSSFFIQGMANATANTSSCALPELLAFVESGLGQARAQALVQKVESSDCKDWFLEMSQSFTQSREVAEAQRFTIKRARF